MRLTAQQLAELDVVDEIVPEVTGGAHVDPAQQASRLGDVIDRQLTELESDSLQTLVDQRYARFRKLGRVQVV